MMIIRNSCCLLW